MHVEITKKSKHMVSNSYFLTLKKDHKGTCAVTSHTRMNTHKHTYHRCLHCVHVEDRQL